ncbi:response regulator [Pelagicoccus sp. SDUM812003]|uniref:response regulator n=1 Tax=Pelagicoccus sp. SDUM812003 TaxID=3041267 RepID=UPI00280CF238|nr:response regulator [Pelagicoccus sp. SDUM812003]MDQ8204013.1 response regulator [Pelagicoccus sp. SDUM812003]
MAIAKSHSTDPADFPSKKGKRVLIVEDDASLSRLLAITFKLKFPHHSLRVTHSGKETLEAIREQKPDILMVDIGLPDMSGLELARKCRELPGMSDVQLYSLSGRGEPKDFLASKRAGFKGHLVKPVDMEVLDKFFRD